MADFVPVPDPRGAMDPPRRNPPTALAAPAYDPEPSDVYRPRVRPRPPLLRTIALAAMEVADGAARLLKHAVGRLG